MESYQSPSDRDLFFVLTLAPASANLQTEIRCWGATEQKTHVVTQAAASSVVSEGFLIAIVQEVGGPRQGRLRQSAIPYSRRSAVLGNQLSMNRNKHVRA
jgi:hypothetical protein